MQDENYKRIFAFPDMVADLLRWVAPARVSARLDYATLEKVSAEHVSDRLQRRLGDALWRLRVKPSDGAAETPRPAPGSPGPWAYLALEFQSHIDVDMALRICTYVALTLEGLRARASTADRASARFLPEVTAVVVYNGDRPWSSPLALSERFAPADPWFAETRPGQQYRLVDLRRLEQDDSKSAGLVTGLAALEQSRSLAELAAAGTTLTDRLRTVANADLARALGDWVRQLATRIAPKEARAIASTFWETDMTLEERVAEWPKQWKQEGLEEGLERGREEGLEEGLEQGLERGLERGLEQGREQGLEQGLERGREQGLAAGMAHGRAMLARQATTRFGVETGAKLSAALGSVSDQGRLTEVSDAIVRCDSAEELLLALGVT